MNLFIYIRAKFFPIKRRWRICKGATRIVLLTGSYAIKIPLLSSWKSTLNGLLANLQERQFSATGWIELCPVLYSDPIGLVVIMPRCMPLRRDLFASTDWESWRNKDDYCIPVEIKHDSFGYLKNRGVVAIDYGS